MYIAIVRINCGQSEIKYVLAPKLLSPCYKRIGYAFSCAYIELWMHAGSLESIQEGRVALGCAYPASRVSSIFLDQSGRGRDLVSAFDISY